MSKMRTYCRVTPRALRVAPPEFRGLREKRSKRMSPLWTEIAVVVLGLCLYLAVLAVID